MAHTRAGSQALIRDLNRSRVFNLIAEQGPLSRIELARRSDLTATAITHIINDFLEAGLVQESAAPEVSMGRRPVLLTLNASAAFVVGVKLREDGCTVVICDLSCAVLHTSETEFTPGLQPHQIVERIGQAVERDLGDAGIPRTQVLGVGIGVSGLSDRARGVVLYSNFLRWRNVPLGPLLEYQLQLPVILDNDVNTLAIAERHFGHARAVSNAVCVTIGRGVGFSALIQGEIFHGGRGSGTEFGHTTIDLSTAAAACNCGKRGCIEAYASDYGIYRAASAHPHPSLRRPAAGHGGEGAQAEPGEIERPTEQAMQAVVARARAGDPAACAAFEQAGKALGVGVANLINLFDPELILLGGEGMRAGDLILEPLRATVPDHLFGNGEVRELAPIEVISTDEVSWARGAASLSLQEVFRAPIYKTHKPRPIDLLLTSGQLASGVGARRTRRGSGARAPRASLARSASAAGAHEG